MLAEVVALNAGDSTDDGPLLHIDGDAITPLEGVVGFAIASDRRCQALATQEGIVVSEGFRAAVSGRARRYRPRPEIYRWIFWDTLEAPISW